MEKRNQARNKQFWKVPYVLILTWDEFEWMEELVQKEAKHGDEIGGSTLLALKKARTEREKELTALNGERP